MNVLANLSNIVIPVLLFYIIAYGLMSGINVYEEFIKGAKDGAKTVAAIMPTMIGLMTAVGILRASGFLECIGSLAGRGLTALHFPPELMPLALVKMFSSSAATGLVVDIFQHYGPDSYPGYVTSLMMSSTETIFYTMSVYFMAAKVKKTRFTLPGALISTFAGLAASIVLAGFLV